MSESENSAKSSAVDASTAGGSGESGSGAKSTCPHANPSGKSIGIPDDAVKEGDLVFGVFDKEPKRLPFWARERGGKVATDYDVNKLPGQPRGGKDIGPAVLDEAAQTKQQVHFDLNGVDTKQALTGKGLHADSATSIEIRHIRDNWDKFDPKPKFYKNGSEVKPPWM